MKKVSIFVDVQNIYHTTKDQYQCNFDYNAFWARATQGRELAHAFAYAIHRGNEKQQQFQNILRGIGFEVKIKPYIQRSDGSAKGDWDVGITLDVMEYCAQSDIIVLASGDGDFSMLLDRIRKNFTVETEVYGVQALTSLSLINASDRFIPIQEPLLLRAKKQ